MCPFGTQVLAVPSTSTTIRRLRRFRNTSSEIVLEDCPFSKNRVSAVSQAAENETSHLSSACERLWRLKGSGDTREIYTVELERNLPALSRFYRTFSCQADEDR